MPRYKHLFFDLDHTLWDFEAASELSWKHLYDQNQLLDLGIPEFQEFFRVYSRHNDQMWEQFRNGKLSREDLRWKRIWQTLLDFKIYDTPLAKQLSADYLELLPTKAVLIPYAKEILDYCQSRYQLHLITNGFEKTQRLKLLHAGIEGYFKEVFTSERCDSIKPQPEIFHYALKATGADRTESLMIGDALEIDVMGAMNIGMDAVYYNPAALPHIQQPSYEIRHLKELQDLI